MLYWSNIVNFCSSSTQRDKIIRSRPYFFFSVWSLLDNSLYTSILVSCCTAGGCHIEELSTDREDLSRDLRPGLAVPVQPLIGQSSSWKQPGAPDCWPESCLSLRSSVKTSQGAEESRLTGVEWEESKLELRLVPSQPSRLSAGVCSSWGRNCPESYQERTSTFYFCWVNTVISKTRSYGSFIHFGIGEWRELVW